MKHEEQFSFQICGITVAMTSQIIIIATSIAASLAISKWFRKDKTIKVETFFCRFY